MVDGNVVFQLLQNTVQFIDVVTTRGAIRGEELLNVGMLRQQIVDVLNQAQAAAQAAAEDAAQAETPEADTAIEIPEFQPVVED